MNIADGINAFGTKSNIDTESRIRVYAMGDDLVLEESVAEYPSEYQAFTKGAIITTNGHNKINDEGKTFTVEGWLGSEIQSMSDAAAEDKTNRHFVSSSASYSSGKWSMATNYWRNGVNSTFWSYTQPSTGNLSFSWFGNTPTDESLKTLPFTYSLPAPTTNETDAANLQDFVVAYNYEKRSIGPDGKMIMNSGTATTAEKNDITITFRHPLSAIKFIMGKISGSSNTTEDEYVNITKVELVDVKTSGTFSASGSGTNSCSFTCNSTSGSATYSQSQATLRSDIAAGNFNNADSDYIFFMIPQNLSGVKVRLTMTRKKKIITYKSDGTTIDSVSYGDLISFTREVNLSGTWESGKYYTYKINSTVYFGGETVYLDKDQIEVSDGGKITVKTDGSFEFSVGGKTGFNEWVAPLPGKGVNIIKLTFTHSYKNSSQKSARKIWLENASVNPEWTGEGDTTHPHFINPDDIKTYNDDLVKAARALDRTDLWGSDVYYTGYLGDYDDSGGKYSATSHDNNMNSTGTNTNVVSTMYFYLGGQFDYIKIHFDYFGDAGDGKWSAKIPQFNITEVVE